MSGQNEGVRRYDFFISNLSDIDPDGLLETPYLYDFFTIDFVSVGTIHKINKRIMLLAKCQLLHTHNNIAEIRYQLGFETSAYFIWFFKKFEQVTPLEYRKRNSGTFSITN